MIIVADASPLISFAVLERLDILPQIYADIVLPKAVYQEITMPDRPYCETLKAFFADKIRQVNDRLLVQVLQNTIDKGEAEAIALALEQKIPNILIDDYKGRKQAQLNGLQPIGTIGSLLQAKKQNLITTIKPLLDKLIQNDIRISEQLINKALLLAGEQ